MKSHTSTEPFRRSTLRREKLIMKIRLPSRTPGLYTSISLKYFTRKEPSAGRGAGEKYRPRTTRAAKTLFSRFFRGPSIYTPFGDAFSGPRRLRRPQNPSSPGSGLINAAGPATSRRDTPATPSVTFRRDVEKRPKAGNHCHIFSSIVSRKRGRGKKSPLSYFMEYQHKLSQDAS